MIRTLLLGACLAALCGCNASRKTITTGPTPASAEKAADAPKQYEYRDMSRGSTAFSRK